jgi:hypothetical protein
MITLKKEFTTSQTYGSGLALILILLLIYLFSGNNLIIQAVVFFTILLMIWPAPFRYFAILWFALAELMGFIVSRILLSIIFIFMVIPAGILKRGSLRKTLKLGLFNKGNDSVFTSRNHTFSADDLIKPF